MALFQKGFLKYLKSGKYSDIILKDFNGKIYQVHKIILINGSEYFARLLLGNFKESQQKIIELKYPDPNNVFEIALEYLYKGIIEDEINFTPTIIISLYGIADHYLIISLIQYCRFYIHTHINCNNVFEALQTAVQINIPEMINYCCNIISKSFFLIKNVDYNLLPVSVFDKILHHPYLAVKDEYQLFQCIYNYIQAWNDELTVEQINTLMESVRFRWMPFEKLQEICEKTSLSLLPKQLILEAIMFRLKKYELPSLADIEENKNIRFQKRIYCTTFVYKQDFDEYGILYYIATNGGTEPWKNPHETQKVIVTASSIEVGSSKDLLKRIPSELWTKDVPASWFTIDFGKTRRVMPTHYTLRHGGNYRADSLRTWDLQGSLDGNSWTILRRHTQDTSLVDKFATHTWPINTDKSFRYFRILQTGRNSSTHNFLVLSGIEFYGDLYEWEEI